MLEEKKQLHENGGSGGITVQGSFEKRKEATMSEENPHLSKEKAKILSKCYLQDYQEAEKPSNQTLKPTHHEKKGEPITSKIADAPAVPQQQQHQPNPVDFQDTLTSHNCLK